ncbi:hypothetical protein [Aestuariicoccus sp. MJ-SS9]|uniref:hypothetical protein n=1 Tax=Aestuariicoccus sp. MJ-SS9 TaxID=3079855 RepID=UPI002915C260|nr:hypothetical protein [Aestuariicoccus sp. MJ-SS9]MDU8912330.1 hypothetical protein [Aestuariicoccus sp. MJ-SS9]
MSLSELTPHNASSWLALLCKSVSEFIPRAPKRPKRDTVLDDLERLAMLSPHLLADLGFSVDEFESTATAVCWRREDMAVFIATADGHAFAMRDPDWARIQT